MSIITGIYCADYNFPQQKTKVTKGHIHRFPWRGKKNLFGSSLVQRLQKGFQLWRQARAKRERLGAAGMQKLNLRRVQKVSRGWAQGPDAALMPALVLVFPRRAVESVAHHGVTQR